MNELPRVQIFADPEGDIRLFGIPIGRLWWVSIISIAPILLGVLLMSIGAGVLAFFISAVIGFLLFAFFGWELYVPMMRAWDWWMRKERKGVYVPLADLRASAPSAAPAPLLALLKRSDQTETTNAAAAVPVTYLSEPPNLLFGEVEGMPGQLAEAIRRIAQKKATVQFLTWIEPDWDPVAYEQEHRAFRNLEGGIYALAENRWALHRAMAVFNARKAVHVVRVLPGRGHTAKTVEELADYAARALAGPGHFERYDQEALRSLALRQADWSGWFQTEGDGNLRMALLWAGEEFEAELTEQYQQHLSGDDPEIAELDALLEATQSAAWVSDEEIDAGAEPELSLPAEDTGSLLPDDELLSFDFEQEKSRRSVEPTGEWERADPVLSEWEESEALWVADDEGAEPASLPSPSADGWAPAVGGQPPVSWPTSASVPPRGEPLVESEPEAELIPPIRPLIAIYSPTSAGKTAVAAELAAALARGGVRTGLLDLDTENRVLAGRLNLRQGTAALTAALRTESAQIPAGVPVWENVVVYADTADTPPIKRVSLLALGQILQFGEPDVEWWVADLPREGQLVSALLKAAHVIVMVVDPDWSRVQENRRFYREWARRKPVLVVANKWVEQVPGVKHMTPEEIVGVAPVAVIPFDSAIYGATVTGLPAAAASRQVAEAFDMLAYQVGRIILRMQSEERH